MLRTLRTRTAKILCLVAFATIAILAIWTQIAKTKHQNLSAKEIDQLIVKGMTSESVAQILGAPNSINPKFWQYHNARRSRKVSGTYIPAIFGVMFNDSDRVERVIKGPVP